jgi:hypothetical protein
MRILNFRNFLLAKILAIRVEDGFPTIALDYEEELLIVCKGQMGEWFRVNKSLEAEEYW